MAKCLVTGGAGFIGSHVARSLLSAGHEVVVIDDLSGGSESNVPPGAAFVEMSILDGPGVDDLFRAHRFDHVFHLAAYAAEGLSHFIRHFNYSNNVLGSVNLINAAVNHEIKCFVFTSSIAVYGAASSPGTEETVPRPEDCYGIAKYAIEMDLKAAHDIFGLNSIVFRPHNVYGEHQNIGDRYRNVIGIFMNQIMRQEPMTIFGDGQQTRAFSYIADVAPLIARSIEVEAAYNEVINVGADTPSSVEGLARTVAEAMDVAPRIEFLPARREVKDALASHDKARRLFDPGPPMALREGVRRMADWARKVGPRSSKAIGRIEVSKNMPSVWLREHA